MEQEILQQILCELKALNNGQQQLDQRMGRMEQQMYGFDHRFEKVEQRLDKVDHRLDKVEQRLDGFDQRMDNFEQRLDGLDQRMDRLDQKIDQVPKLVADGLTPYFNNLEMYMVDKNHELGSRIKRVTDIQEEQHRIIEKLSYRSFSHEADIENLKKVISNQ